MSVDRVVCRLHSLASTLRLVIATCSLALAVGCAPTPPTTEIRDFSAALAADLHAQSAGWPSDPIIAMSFADIRDLDRTSAMGAMASELVANRLAQLGHDVKDIRLASGWRVAKTGEFILSRDAKDLADKAQARSALVGTYSVGNGLAYVSVRLIRLADGRVIAAASTTTPVDDQHSSIFGGGASMMDKRTYMPKIDP